MQDHSLGSILFKRNNHRPVLFNTVLWLVVFFILLFIFSKGKSPITADYIYTIGFIIVLMIPANINFYWLIPNYLKRERNTMYFALFIIVFASFAFLTAQFFYSSLDVLFPKYFFVSYLSTTNIYITFAIIAVASTLLKLAEDWFYYNTNENRLLKIENQQIQTQLTALRGQINPHFLFNSLNVIYAMALEKQENITSAIVQLSDILRYIIYDADTKRVSLKDELKLIENYIAFQKYRNHALNNVELQTDISDESFEIYPMLLLPLVENAFKYGLIDNAETDFISINIGQKANDFRFEIKNSKTKDFQNTDENYSGVGLKTLRDNLQLVYPNTHTFDIENKEDDFKVSLTLKNE